MSQNVTIQPEASAMLDAVHREQALEDGVLLEDGILLEDGVPADVAPASVALVPMVPNVQWSRVPEQQRSRADFVTHLIATAECAPQTRSLRRATPADAQTAYSSGQQRVPRVGLWTRQVI